MLECAYCLNPKLFDTDFTDCPVEPSRPVVKATGQFWRRLPKRPKLVWPYSFEARRCGNQVSFLVDKKNFASKWKSFTVIVMGLDYTERPPVAPSPLFHGSHTIDFTQTYKMGEDYYDEEAKAHSWQLFNACRITHDDSGLCVKLHWWPSHSRIFTVENFNFQQASSAIELKQALSFFSLGRGRPTEHFANTAEFSQALRTAILSLSKHKEVISEAAAAELMCGDDSFNSRVLRRWLNKSNWVNFKWQEIVRAIIDDEKLGYFRSPELDKRSPFDQAEFLTRREKRT